MLNEEEFFQGVKKFSDFAKHEVGQNFLVDSEIAARIVGLLDAEANETVLEIGSGAGSLSFFLNRTGAQADLIDIDDFWVSKTRDDFGENPKINSIQANALKWDFSRYQKIISNLPYYITTSLIEKAAMESTSAKKMVFMIQKEAFCRVFSKKKTPDYGPLNILLATFYRAKTELLVSPQSFVPIPHVASVVFSLTPIKPIEPSFSKKYYRFLKICFQHRRKTISNNLSRLFENADEITKVLSLLDIDPRTRPEEIDPLQYLALFEATNRTVLKNGSCARGEPK